MQINEKKSLLSALQQGTVTVTFRKIDTDEIRVMPCTLNLTVLEALSLIHISEPTRPY